MDPILRNYLRELVKDGFRVYVTAGNRPTTYAHFTKDDKIGYVQYNNMDGLTFSTVHKPNQHCGTGFSVDATVKPELCFLDAPGWAGSRSRQGLVKYKNWQQFADNSILQRVELTLDDLTLDEQRPHSDANEYSRFNPGELR